jgi:HAD superfamily hydrolase (TIGR01662 family)
MTGVVPPKIRAVLFDYGDTLMDVRDPEQWCEVARRQQLEIEPEHFAHSFAEALLEYDNPRRAAEPEPAFWQWVLARACERDVSLDVVDRFIAELDQLPRRSHLFSDARRCLEEIQGSGRRMGIISNSRSEASLRARLGPAGVEGFFATIVSSGTEGIRKPNPEIFRRALDRMQVAPGDSLYVGDMPNTDARAARAVGMHSVWLNRNGTGFGDDPPEITSLLEVPLVVKRIESGSTLY